MKTLMKQLLKSVVLSLLVCIVVIGCKSAGVTVGQSNGPSPGVRGGPPPHAPAHGYRRKFGYDYYPDQNVYYARDRGTYFWLQGENWKVGVELPSHIALNLGGHVSIELDTQTPYEHHDAVAKKHPGKGRGKGKGKGRGRGRGNSGRR